MMTAIGTHHGHNRSDHPTSYRLHNDRITAMIVWAAVIVLMAVMIWLAVLGSPAPDGFEEFWHIMP